MNTPEQLLVQVAEGNESAFRQLFVIQHKKLAGFIFRLTQDHGETQDILQEVFLKIWINRKELQKIENFDAYLYSMSKNYALNTLKKTAREFEKRNKWFIINSDGNIGIEEQINYKEAVALLEQAINTLPPQQKKVYTLNKEAGLSYEAIATEMNLSLHTVKKHMAMSMRSLRFYIKKHALALLIFLLPQS